MSSVTRVATVLLALWLIAGCGAPPQTTTSQPTTEPPTAAAPTVDPASPTLAPPTATTAPAATSAPTATTAPTNTLEPAATAAPTNTPEPAATTAPTNTPEPAATTAPTAIPPTAVPPTAVPPTAVPPTAVPPTQSDDVVARGLQVYTRMGCGGCHALNAAGASGSVGPPHNGMGATAAQRIASDGYTGRANSAAGYIRESIVEPSVYLVPGFEGPAVMPPFSNLSEEDLEALVAMLVRQ